MGQKGGFTVFAKALNGNGEKKIVQHVMSSFLYGEEI